MIGINFDKIPDELKKLPQWVVWGVDKNNPKCPYNPMKSNMRAGAGEPSTWGDYKKAAVLVGLKQAQGIGFEFHNNGVYGVDLDHVLIDGKLSPEAAEIIKLLDSYTEISPSGKGIHIFVKATGVKLERKKVKLTDTTEIEMYHEKRYFTMTGDIYGELKPINERTAQLQTVYDKYMKPKQNPSHASHSSQPTADYLKVGLEKDSVMLSLWNGDRPNGNESADDQALMNKLGYWLSGDKNSMISAFKASPHWGQKDEQHKKKCDRDDYLSRTAESTLRTLTDTAEAKDQRFQTENNPSHASHSSQPTAENENIEWEPPISFYNIAVPVFPVDCLPSNLKNFVLALSEETQTAVDMSAVGVLAAISCCVQGKFVINPKPGWTEPLNIYCGVVANPGERKSAVVTKITQPLYVFECKKNEELRPAIEKSRAQKMMLEKRVQAAINEAAKPNGTGTTENVMKAQEELTNFKEIPVFRLIADNTTPESLTSLMAENDGKISVISTEGGIFESIQNGYRPGIDIDIYLKAHSNDPHKVDRKGRPSEYISKPSMTIYLSFQPSVLDGLINHPVLRSKGLVARFLFAVPQSPMGNRRYETISIPTEIEDDYKELCTSLLEIKQPEKPALITLTEEAQRLNVDFFNSLEPRLVDDLEEMQDFGGKLHGAIMRIAGILHIVNQSVFAELEPLPAKTMQDAIDVGNYFLEHAKLSYRMMGADKDLADARYIIKKLNISRPLFISRRDLLRECQRFSSVEMLDKPMQLLIEYGYIIEKNNGLGGNGKPLVVYHINPLGFKNLD